MSARPKTINVVVSGESAPIYYKVRYSVEVAKGKASSVDLCQRGIIPFVPTAAQGWRITYR